MVFSSIPFLFVFLPLVLILYYLSPKKFKNILLLLANLVFYAYGEPVYVLLMAGSIIVNFFAGKLIGKTEYKKISLIISIIINIGVLCFFKYTPFVFDTLKRVTALSFLPDVKIALPIGISFYTFQAVSYLIDVYRGECENSESFINFATYISLFPQLIAGPIVRYSDVNNQLSNRKETFEKFSDGVRLFTCGLAKKVLLANQLGQVWSTVSNNPSSFGTATCWLGAICYTLQIYFDFGGYSDMARGLGNMFGFDFCINFNYPYISKSVTEFWRRWHISLSTWFKDYVYIPLGGNRVGKPRFIFNILLVWTLTGLWHGAGWNFILWGFYYGIILLVEKLVINKYLKKLPDILRHIYAMLIVVIGWVFFASDNFSSAVLYIKSMFSIAPSSAKYLSYLPITLIGIFAAMPWAHNLWDRLKSRRYMYILEAIFIIFMLVLCTASLVSDTYNPFLYFRF